MELIAAVDEIFNKENINKLIPEAPTLYKDLVGNDNLDIDWEYDRATVVAFIQNLETRISNEKQNKTTVPEHIKDILLQAQQAVETFQNNYGQLENLPSDSSNDSVPEPEKRDSKSTEFNSETKSGIWKWRDFEIDETKCEVRYKGSLLKGFPFSHDGIQLLLYLVKSDGIIHYLELYKHFHPNEDTTTWTDQEASRDIQMKKRDLLRILREKAGLSKEIIKELSRAIDPEEKIGYRLVRE